MNRLVSLYKADKRWVNWENRNERKLPVDPKTGRLAKSDDPRTWGTYAVARKNSSDIGFMLGRVSGVGGDYYICGIDLDGCLNGKNLRPEAREIVDRFKKYTEVSPSGHGVHIIFAANASVIDRIRKEFDFEHRKSFSIGQHQEIALDVSGRYYTVTEDAYNNYDLIDSVRASDLEWFLRDAGPAFQSRHHKNGHEVVKRDNSRSGHAFRFLLGKYKAGVSEEDAIAELLTRKDDGGRWAREVDKRQRQRAWSNAVKYSDEKEHETNGVDASYLTSELASDIEVKPIRWMWPYYFAKGKLFMIVGEPDRGKSTVALDLAARISKGARWPDKSGRAPRGDVLMFNAEDDKSDTTIPRLMAAGADLKHIRIMRMSDDRMFSLSKNLKMLETHITKYTRMIIIDPVMAYLGAGVDSFKGSDVRSTLSPLVSLAEKHDIVVLLLHHYNKGGNGKGKATPMHRISDSMAFGAICRHIYTCDRAPEDKGETEYGFAKIRNSNAPMKRGGGLGYDIKTVDLGDGIVSSRINWDPQPITWTPEDAINPAKNGATARSDAGDFLQEELSKSPAACAKIIEKAELRNISRRTLYRAADLLNISKYRQNGEIFWAMSSA